MSQRTAAIERPAFPWKAHVYNLVKLVLQKTATADSPGTQIVREVAAHAQGAAPEDGR